jgi:hypothetical protein
MKAQVKSATDITKDPLQGCKMRLARIMHVKTHLLNGIGNIWPSEGEVL